ncbi:MAG: D-2-hydroxyacid dehydrogenase family protein [Dehalococcoidia bacterium]|nr:D-2-hydroxyacid dehydrogenase family protein [Dehalococcoidia bacterium]
MLKIAVIDDYTGDAINLANWNRLSNKISVDFFQDHITSLEKLSNRLSRYEVLVIMRERTQISRELIKSLPNLRMIVTSGMYNAAIDFSAAKECNIIVTGTNSSGISTTEQTWALILALSHNVVLEHNNMIAGRWQKSLATELHGKNLGLIGLGRIGLEVGKIGLAFGMEVYAWSQNLNKEFAEEHGINFLQTKEQICEISDILSLHVRLSERTKHLIDAKEFEIMKKDAFLINTARGPIINENELIIALQNNKIAGAGLDVYEYEPLPTNHNFLKLNNIVLSPHIGYGTKELMSKFFEQIVENIEAYLNDKPIRIVE